jgi:hypothetical protein
MSLHAYVADIAQHAQRHAGRMPESQALVYGVEHVVERVMPSRVLTSLNDARQWLERVCETEGWDTPEVQRIRSTKWSGVASSEWQVIGLSTRATVLTLAHELAHVTCGADGHGEVWREQFVHIVREHVSVQHASLLHTLYNRFRLDSGQWRLSETSRL